MCRGCVKGVKGVRGVGGGGTVRPEWTKMENNQ